MLSIGDVARLAGVTPRVLRHYDEIGLFVPQDFGANGYRRYAPAQLTQLHRILALRDLGFRLEQIGALVRDDITAEQLREMLHRRERELAADLDATNRRLDQVRRHLAGLLLESRAPGGHAMPELSITVTDVPAVHVAEVRGVSPTYDPVDVGPTVSPLFARLFEVLQAASVTVSGPAIAYYEDDPESGGILVHAAAPVAADVVTIDGLDVVDLPALDRAACSIHVGSMANIVGTVAAMFEWIAEQHLRTTGYSREVYLDCPPDLAAWRTEIQFPVERA